MNPLKKVALYNLLAILIYSAILRLVTQNEKESLIFMSAAVVVLHVFVCLVVSISFIARSDKPYMRAWLLTTGLVLLVGFSACLGNTAI